MVHHASWRPRGLPAAPALAAALVAAALCSAASGLSRSGGPADPAELQVCIGPAQVILDGSPGARLAYGGAGCSRSGAVPLAWRVLPRGGSEGAASPRARS